MPLPIISKKQNFLLQLILSTIFITILCGFVYVEIQQSLRQSANFDQAQIAQDDLAVLKANPSLHPNTDNKIDIAQSLASFVMLFDADGKLLSSPAILDGAAPELPKGILDSAKVKGENHVTWQPKNGVRIALVVLPIKDASDKTTGFVAVGKSLREVEKIEKQTLVIATLAWLALLILNYLSFFIRYLLYKTSSTNAKLSGSSQAGYSTVTNE